MYNRAFPVGNALFLFAGGVMGLFRLPRGKLLLAFLAVPAGKDGWVPLRSKRIDRVCEAQRSNESPSGAFKRQNGLR